MFIESPIMYLVSVKNILYINGNFALRIYLSSDLIFFVLNVTGTTLFLKKSMKSPYRIIVPYFVVDFFFHIFAHCL